MNTHIAKLSTLRDPSVATTARTSENQVSGQTVSIAIEDNP